MKVTIEKTYTNENGTSFLKGRTLDLPKEEITKLEKLGVITVTKEKPKKK